MPPTGSRLTSAQLAFLESIAIRIPLLLDAIKLGNQRSEFILGRRQIRGRQVRLMLVAEVVDAGANPLATHSSRTPGAETFADAMTTVVESPAKKPAESSAKNPAKNQARDPTSRIAEVDSVQQKSEK